MRISVVNGIQSQTKFRGLWGDTKTCKGESALSWNSDVYDYVTKEYHPFADESLESLSKIQKQNSTYKTIGNPERANSRIHVGTNISIKSSLLFTTKQWLNYISYKMSAGCPEFKFIENNLRDLHLERYLRI